MEGGRDGKRLDGSLDDPKARMATSFFFFFFSAIWEGLTIAGK